jgi:hypothetical protein
MESISKQASTAIRGFFVCVGILVVEFTNLHAQFNGLFVRTDEQSVAYFDLSQAGGVVEGFLFHTGADSSKSEGVVRQKTEVRGRAEGGKARLSSTFFFLSEQIGLAQSSPGGFTLRLTADDGTLQELQFRRATSSQVNTAIRSFRARAERANVAWRLHRQHEEIAARYVENRRQLPEDIATIRDIESRLLELVAKEAESQTNLRVAEANAQAAHERARKAREDARTTDEEYQATKVEYAATSADYQVTSAQYRCESVKSDLDDVRTRLTDAQTSAATRRRQLTADSTWLSTNRFPLP